MKLQTQIKDNVLNVVFEGDYIAYNNDAAMSALLKSVQCPDVQLLELVGTSLGRWDSTLTVLLFELVGRARRRNIKIQTQNMPDNLMQLVDLALSVDRRPEQKKNSKGPFLETLGGRTLEIWSSIKKGMAFIGQTIHSIGRFFTGMAVMRRVDWLFALEDCSYKAVGIVSLVSFMVGLILAFVGAIQLKTFGAQIYVASLVAIGMTRIMGAIMVGVVMAGRTGAAYAATIGTMQVNEEIDALKTMGIPVADFLVLPRIMALTITMPLLTILADFMGIIGGAAVGVIMLGISAEEYWMYSTNALSMDNFLVGLFHGLVFGAIISICGCYYGIYCGRNADSVGKATTQAVVSAIVWMIVATGVITWIFEVLGI